MKPHEKELMIKCCTVCAFEIYKTLKIFKDISPAERKLLRLEIDKNINRYIEELQK